MKIAVTSQNFRTVTGHAGRARRFLVYDVQPDTHPVEVARLDLPKELAIHDFDGDGPHPIDGIDVILTEGFGDGFARRIARRGITAVVTTRSDPIEAVSAYLAGERVDGTAPAASACTCGDANGHDHQHDHHH
ncbi:MAG: nitrogen fixation protein [Rhodospirillales bacterium]|nr:nitrogen fixation protein [Rhodospirillales bacterium]